MKKVILLTNYIFYSVIVFSQINIDRQVIGSTGNITNAGRLIVYSNVGESLISTSPSSTLIVTQGFEQPDSMFIIIGTKYVSDSKINITAYPNPTMDKVILDFKDFKENNVIIEVVNLMGQIQGNLIFTSIQANIEKEIDFNRLPSGSYYIIIKSSHGKLLKSFKIQKIN